MTHSFGNEFGNSMTTFSKRKIDIGRALAEGSLIDEGVEDGLREAVELHRRLGLPIVIWRNGRPTWVMPHDPDTEVPAPGSPVRTE
jgi:hypothetical protein